MPGLRRPAGTRSLESATDDGSDRHRPITANPGVRAASGYGRIPGRREFVIRVAIVGRPNVGKSTLFNRMLGEERSVVHDLPGTTRDAIDTQIDTAEGPIRFIDTAGMRRRSRTEEGTEYYAMVRALAALDHADVVLLVIDATDGVTHQDQRLAERIGVPRAARVVIILEQVGAARRRGPPRRRGRGRGPARLPGRVAGGEGERPERHGGPQDPPRPAPVPVEAYHQPHPDRASSNRAIRVHPATHAAARVLGSATRCRGRSTPRPSPCSPLSGCHSTVPPLRWSASCADEFGIGPTPGGIRVPDRFVSNTAQLFRIAIDGARSAGPCRGA